jgi:glyoxylase-like metal-dependent hydrolase (beta-lactamase superfamily II)/rhodanese-related sulfurtransferase
MNFAKKFLDGWKEPCPMVRSLTPAELYAEIDEGRCPYVLDVRNQDEYATWQIEGTRPVPMRNVPIWVAVEESETLAREIPEDTVVVCAHGNGSDLLIDVLKDEGREVRTLEGGTAAWAQLLVPRPIDGIPDGMVGYQIARPSKACLSYVIGVPGHGCVVVDPARFPETYLDLAARHDMDIAHVIDTHIHADHISGGPALAERFGVPYHVPMEDAGPSTPFTNEPLADGAVLDLGAASLEVLAIKMPGHTPGSTCVHIPGHLLLTGDTVFVRGLGRPDLTGKADELATELFHTIHDRLAPLDPATKVMPAHWTIAEEIDNDGMVQTTIGKVFEADIMTMGDIHRFIDEIIATLPAAPDFYDTIRLVNAGQAATAEEIETLEIGKNQCAASTSI